jgi:N-acetylglucosaminyl-diphospho-decaprenol L-rhamnosyltransferase
VIDVVVVTADSREMVLGCLRHLSEPRIAKTVVVDNGSVDGTAQAIAEGFPSVEVLRLEKPEGLASAFNRGAARGSSSLLLFLNDDILAAEGAIARLAESLEGNPDVVAVAGRLIDPQSGATQLEYQPKRFPTPMTFLSSLAGLHRVWPHNPWTGAHLRRPLDERETVRVDQPSGACLLVRREAFEQIGGWDDGYSFWYEDVDLARRLRSKGAVLYVPAAVFGHVGGYSARRLSRAEVVERSYTGTLRYAEKHLGARRRIVGAAFALTATVKAPLVKRRDPQLAAAYRRLRRQALELALGSRPGQRP